jgi:glucose-6-phosphate isomerase
MTGITQKASYLQLKKQQLTIKTHSLRRLFEEDKQRAFRFSLEVDGLYFDYSKNHITPEVIDSLCQFAKEQQLPEAIQALYSGQYVNNTEKRPALHTALRFQGTPCSQEETLVANTKAKMAECVKKIHARQWLGFSGKPIDTVINIGIGGSDLGPRMVVQALRSYKQNIAVQFVSNIDGSDLLDKLEQCNPETTLFIIASKTFTTLETIENAQSARQWIIDHAGNTHSLNKHFIGITADTSKAEAFGIQTDNIFPIWDWVGGRYSLWSAIGLPIAIAVGMHRFEELLSGAHSMDKHYLQTEIKHNLPATAALITFWYSQFWQAKTHAILPYAQRLSQLPAFLQQLEMESLGKSVTRTGKNVDYSTGNIIWGAEGTNGQHSFHQLLHQGTECIPADFITLNTPTSTLRHQHTHLQACCISQSQALLKGKTLADAENELRRQGFTEKEVQALAPHKVVLGNKPSNTLIMNELSPKTLGSLLAFYEHKVHTLGTLLDINPFDQWGVELGKQLSKPIHDALHGEPSSVNWDQSTLTLIDKLTKKT